MLQAPSSDASAVDLAKRRFALDGTRRAIKKLGDDLLRAVEETQAPLEAYRGGPPGIWGERLRPHAEASRERLLSQVLLARHQVVEDVGEALLPQAGPGPLRDAVAWLRMDLALAHSELYGEAGVRPPRHSDDQKGDPRLRFLLEELDKALQNRNLQYYQDLTREYLISLRSFLRS